MEVLIAIVFVLAVITLLGHAIWLMFAALIKALTGQSGLSTNRPLRAEMCPRCGAVWEHHPGNRGCTLCGWPEQVGGTARGAGPGPGPHALAPPG